MKLKLAFLIVLLITFNKSFSQCFNLEQLKLLTEMDLEKRDKFLNENGFEIYSLSEKDLSLFGVGWKNEKLDIYIQIKNTGKKFDRLNYRLKANQECYDLFKEELTKQNYIKEKENFKYNAFYYFYNKENSWIFLNKFKNGDENYYSINLLSREEYIIESK